MDRTRITPALRTIVGISLFVALIASLPPGTTLRAQSQSTVFFSAVDSAGKAIPSLSAADVTVTEDDAACKTVKVEPIEWPMKITVLVDNGTGSSAWLGDMRSGLQGFFDAVPDGVEVSLLTIGSQPRWVVHPTTDRGTAVKGISLIAPDPGAPMFVDALLEAAKRIDKDKTPQFPVIVIFTSDVGSNSGAHESQFEQVEKLAEQHAMTVHFILLATSSQSSGVNGTVQTNLGSALSQITGGRFESINSTSRLATLFPEIGKQIARSNELQMHQFRITYERTGKSTKPAQRIGITTTAGVHGTLSFDGHIPAS